MDVSFDFYDYVLELTSQIPKGKISTYKELAKALGDEISARAVGTALSHNPAPVKIPCHRVIHSDGRTGGYKFGVEKKIELLKKEWFIIDNEDKGENAKIKNFESCIFNTFRTNYPLKHKKKFQENLSKKVVVKDVNNYTSGYANNKIKICGADVAYKFEGDKEYGFGVLVAEDKNFSHKIFSSEMRINFPYIPTYLSFREMPVIEELINNAVNAGMEKDEILLMMDGNGILHPGGIGLASHVGVELDIATIGVAKKLLCGKVINNEVFIDGNAVGEKIGKIYVSPGHKISSKTAVSIVRKFMKFSVPEPLRMAHIYANKNKNKEKF